MNEKAAWRLPHSQFIRIHHRSVVAPDALVKSPDPPCKNPPWFDAHERLRSAPRAGESFSAVVRRASFGPADAYGRSILAALKEKPVLPCDEKAARKWENEGMEIRSSSLSAWEGIEDS